MKKMKKMQKKTNTIRKHATPSSTRSHKSLKETRFYSISNVFGVEFTKCEEREVRTKSIRK